MNVVPSVAQPTAPRTERGRRTRHHLVRAAREVFEREGYFAARVTDITSVADVAVGTFYTYFTSKEEIFLAVVGDIGDEVYASGSSDDSIGDPIDVIDAANRRFLVVYRENARLMAVVEQAATISEDFRQSRRLLRNRMVQRVERSLRSMQAGGVADPSLDAHCAASALVSMVSNFAYSWLVIGEPFEEDVAVATLTKLWVQAIGLLPVEATASDR